MAITPLPDPPSRSDDPANFSTKADALLGALPTFVTEANALQTDVNAKQVTASAAATTASAAASAAASDAARAEEAAAAAEDAAGFPPSFGRILKTYDTDQTISSNTNAVVGIHYQTNTSGGAFTLTLPASPAVGDYVGFQDKFGTFATNNITVARNGKKILNAAEDFIADINWLNLRFVFISESYGWGLQ